MFHYMIGAAIIARDTTSVPQDTPSVCVTENHNQFVTNNQLFYSILSHMILEETRIIIQSVLQI